MSSSYTTTTSATGMPSLDIDYRRSNSANIQDDRRSRSPSPSPKANRAKSYAGIYNRPEIRREFIKSQSFCQPSLTDSRNSLLLKGQDDDETRDSIFKAELACSDSNFVDDNNTNDNITDDEIFDEATAKNDVEMNVVKDKAEDENQSELSSVPLLPTVTCDEDRRHSSFNDAPVADTTGIIKPVALKPDSLNSPDQRRALLCNRKLENLSVAQVAPVRKNSRDESALRVVSSDGHGSRRGSGALLSIFTQADWQHELTVAGSKEIQDKMEHLLSWEFPIFELNEKCHILTQVI